MYTWLAHSLRRFYPASKPESVTALTLDAARGERLSFQAVCRTEAEALLIEAEVQAPADLTVMIRRVGYVPLPHLNTDVPLDEIEGAEHLPGYVPDPLFPQTSVQAGPYETHAFWVTVSVPTTMAPGQYPVAITFSASGQAPTTLTSTLTVHPATMVPRRNFPVTHWLHADALCDWYKVELSDEAFWSVLDPYLANLASHGLDMLYVPLFTPPLDGVKRPTQLLGVHAEQGCYTFDWTLVRRWVQAAQAHGLRYFEWPHLFAQWGARSAIRIYEGHGETSSLLWSPETAATSPTYRDFLSQFLPQFELFLRAEGLVEQSFFHLSDEPNPSDLDSYRAARKMLHELAPWMKVMDALSEIQFAREGLTDIPIPRIDEAPNFVSEGFPAWAYFCCAPRGRYLNRLLDTPLVKIRQAGWLFYALGAQGFLHWGYNYWYQNQTTHLIDPYTTSDAMNWPEWPYGDPFLVYPGESGPVDSLRWEVFAESLQDFALLQACNISRTDPLFTELRSYSDFPRDTQWLMQRRAQLLAQLDQRIR